MVNVGYPFATMAGDLTPFSQTSWLTISSYHASWLMKALPNVAFRNLNSLSHLSWLIKEVTLIRIQSTRVRTIMNYHYRFGAFVGEHEGQWVVNGQHGQCHPEKTPKSQWPRLKSRSPNQWINSCSAHAPMMLLWQSRLIQINYQILSTSLQHC